MIKTIFLTFAIIFLNNCSFDNKTGIWTGSNEITKKSKNSEQNLEIIFKKQQSTIKDKLLSSNKIIKFEKPKLIKKWSQSYQNDFNNIGNISFANKGNYKKLSKISRSQINENILIYQNNLFFSDSKGNIGIYSLNKNQLIFKYNFYKKKIKKTKKNIKIIIRDDSIIAADNLGYIYSINYKNNKLNWAKNYLVPFRSNLKIIDKTLFLSDEKNKIILIDINNGNKIDEFYTQPSKTVSKFENNLAVDNNKNLIFLSTNGSLYSLNLINQKTINWIQNFKSESEIIFNARPITISNDKLMISTNNYISLLNTNGSKIWDLNIESNISPVISGNTIFTINKENYLILIDSDNGEIIYSQNINLLIKNNFKKNFQRKIKKIDYIYLTNNKLLLITDNSYFIEINLENLINISSIRKNSFDIASHILFLKSEMIFVSKSKRIYKVN